MTGGLPEVQLARFSMDDSQCAESIADWHEQFLDYELREEFPFVLAGRSATVQYGTFARENAPHHVVIGRIPVGFAMHCVRAEGPDKLSADALWTFAWDAVESQASLTLTSTEFRALELALGLYPAAFVGLSDLDSLEGEEHASLLSATIAGLVEKGIIEGGDEYTLSKAAIDILSPLLRSETIVWLAGDQDRAAVVGGDRGWWTSATTDVEGNIVIRPLLVFGPGEWSSLFLGLASGGARATIVAVRPRDGGMENATLSWSRQEDESFTVTQSGSEESETLDESGVFDRVQEIFGTEGADQ